MQYTCHKIDFNNVEILAEFEEKNYQRIIIEGLEIRKLGGDKANLASGVQYILGVIQA